MENPSQQTLKMRDMVHSLISKGATDVTDSNNRDALRYISIIKGEPFARKLFNQISLFNQRDDVKSSGSPDERINKFYTIGSKDKEVQTLIDSFKGLGGKPVTTDSPLRANIDMGMGVNNAISPSVKGIINSGNQ